MELLNKEQKKAVENNENSMLVIAGAGTGKTKVIIHKVAHLINEMNVNPGNILSVTFTNKAAREMKERLTDIVGSVGDEVWMGTFHSVCLRILRRESARAGLKSGFGVIDQEDRLSAVRNIVKELNIDHKKYPPKQYLWLISSYKNTMDYVKNMNPEESLYRFIDVFNAYQQYLSFGNLIDFDDMLAIVVRIFDEFPELTSFYQNLFHYILVDEYQDTNYIQFVFLKFLTGYENKICVVGDDDQSIYGWRGAEIRNILDFEKKFENVKVVKLTENYRSPQNILDKANLLISNNKYRKDKNLRSSITKNGSISVIECNDEVEEAKRVVKNLKCILSEENISEKDIAILYRTNAQSRNFEVELNKQKIPYKVIGGLSFYSRREIKDILAYLKIIDNPYDIDSLKRACKNPPKGIGNIMLQKIIDNASSKGVDLLESTLSTARETKGRSGEKLKYFCDILDSVRNSDKIADKVKTVIKLTGYNSHLKQFEEQNEANKRINNIDELINAAVIFDENSLDSDLSDFLATTTLTTSNDEEISDSISLMTMHSAKGLEFDSVFLTGLEEGLFPLFRAMENEMELEEERRLCYVGITRAKRNLFLTYTNTRMVYGRRQFSSPSVFIDEIGNTAPELSEEISDVRNDRLKPNTKVFHKKYGEGIILNATGNGENTKVDIFFKNSGLKKMLAESIETL